MTKFAFLSVSVLAFMLTACGDNIRPAGTGTDEECFDEDCPADIDQPDGGTSTPDAGGGTPDAGAPPDGADQPDGGSPPDGGAPPECQADADCGEGQACVEGACVCDRDGDVSEEGCAPDEVQLCHVPPGNGGAAHGICVGSSAATAHLAHGDTLGACP